MITEENLTLDVTLIREDGVIMKVLGGVKKRTSPEEPLMITDHNWMCYINYPDKGR